MPRRAIPQPEPLVEVLAEEELYEEYDEEEPFDEPDDADRWQGDGGPPEGEEEAYAAAAPVLPPTRVRSAAKQVLDQMQGVKPPPPASVVRDRTVTVVAKRTVSTRDPAGTLDSRTYEITLSETGSMSYEDSRRITTVLTNDATAIAAEYLDVPTLEDNKGRLRWGALSAPSRPAAAPMGAGAPPPGYAAPAAAQVATPSGPALTQGYRPAQAPGRHSPALIAAMWEDYVYGAGTQSYWENFMDFADKTKFARKLAIKPKSEAIVAEIMAAIGEQGPPLLKSVFLEDAPPGVQQAMGARGLPVR